jgi:hypothetical protein
MATTRSQGIATIEPAEAGGFLICLPDGRVEQRTDEVSADALCKAWATHDLRTYGGPGVLTIHWRDGAHPVRQVRTDPRGRRTRAQKAARS